MKKIRRGRTAPVLPTGSGFALVTFLALSSVPSFALHFRSGIEFNHGLPQSGKRLTFSTVDRLLGDRLSSMGLSLRSGPSGSFPSAVKDMLRDAAVHPLLGIKDSKVNGGFALSDGSQSFDFRFHIGGIELCGFQVRGHQLSDGSSLVVGVVPDIDLYEDLYEPSPRTDWPDLDLTKDRIRNSLEDEYGAHSVSFGTPKKCYYASHRNLLPVWEMIASSDSSSYVVRADGYEVASMEPRFFATTGTARVFSNNRFDTELRDFTLPDLIGNGRLESPFLRTVPPDGRPVANEGSHVFAYSPDDLRFDEVMIFTQAQRHLAFVNSMGFEWYGPKPLEIRPHAPPFGRPNNALFEPGDENDQSLPRITVDSGDGRRLQNLVSDGDVVSHELGHHVIYRTLKTTNGESLVLHEGLADFLVFSRTGDPCLGESICPADSFDCILQGQCLRTANNDLVYGDDLWERFSGPSKRLGHLHGQLISGMLWDLRSMPGVAGEDITRLTLKSISLFAETSGICDFLASLLAADNALYGQRFREGIITIARNRGLGTYLDELDTCPVNLVEIDPASGESPKESKKNKKILGFIPTSGCGTVSASPRQKISLSGWFVLTLGLPLLVIQISSFKKPAYAPRRSRKSRNARKEER